jgi:hypothetical protein
MFVMYSLASLPLIAAFSMLFSTELVGLIVFVIVNILVCFLDMVLGFVVVFFQGQSSNGGSNVGVIMTNIRLVISILFPTVNLKHALFNIHLRSSNTCIAAVNSIMNTSDSSSEPWMSTREPGLGVPFIIFVSQMIAWWLIVMFIEQSNRLCQKKSGSLHDNPQTIPTEWNDFV